MCTACGVVLKIDGCKRVDVGIDPYGMKFGWFSIKYRHKLGREL